MAVCSWLFPGGLGVTAAIIDVFHPPWSYCEEFENKKVSEFVIWCNIFFPRNNNLKDALQRQTTKHADKDKRKLSM